MWNLQTVHFLLFSKSKDNEEKCYWSGQWKTMNAAMTNVVYTDCHPFRIVSQGQNWNHEGLDFKEIRSVSYFCIVTSVFANTSFLMISLNKQKIRKKILKRYKNDLQLFGSKIRNEKDVTQ